MDTTSLITIGLACLIGSFITAWVFAIIFQSKRKLELQKTQINLLYKIAEKAGVATDDLNEIVSGV